MIVCLSGRGDKDVVQVKDRLEVDAARREKLMPKDTNRKIKTLSKQLEKEFSFPISWLETMIKVWMV